MKKLFVFIGKPGVGKTTLINTVFAGSNIIDVTPYIRNYLDKNRTGFVPEDKTIQGYKDMYIDLNNMNDEQIILELGTNHPDLNIKELHKLSNSYNIHIFLCLAKKDTCRERALARSRFIDPPSLERRLERNFPNSHLKILTTTNLSYHSINTEKPISHSIQIIKKYRK